MYQPIILREEEMSVHETEIRGHINGWIWAWVCSPYQVCQRACIC